MAQTIEDCGSYSRLLISGFPELLGCHRLNPDRYPFLLESVSHGSSQSRFDILFAFPGETLRLNALSEPDFLSQLDQTWASQPCATDSSLGDLPFRGGWFLYLGYELLGQIESKLSRIPVAQHYPVAQATRISAAVIRDHLKKQCWLVAENDALDTIQKMHSDLASLGRNRAQQRPVTTQIEEDPEADFLAAVRKALNYCYEGDIFQANLSRRWSAQLDPSTTYIDVYEQLRQSNPAPFSGLAKVGDASICSSSPERLIKCQGDRLDMRPIAGTRPRGETSARDSGHSTELLQHPKERAEHLMLLDLIRNDLGRVCDYGTVEVDEQMILESYATVHHIVSNVTGRKRPGVTPGDIIRAVFPGGTITGCPKVRCMEIIAELEQTPRGAYTGSMGYLNRNGDLDLNILIRTLVIQGRQLEFRAGAGIVADSIPKNELLETRHKARGLLRAIGVDA